MREKVNRAHRYPIDIAVSYRPTGETQWREGKTENFAYSGLLLRSRELLKAGTKIELKLQLPAFIIGESAAWIVCEGKIMRLQAGSQPEGEFSYAVGISQYEIVRLSKAVVAKGPRSRRRRAAK
jgi:hypothetical protein